MRYADPDKIKSYQTELWQECNNLCAYCYLGQENRKTPDSVKEESLRIFLKKLDSFDFENYNNISFIGGEFFQGQLSTPEIKRLFMEIMNKVHCFMKEGKLRSVWITATLTIGDQPELYEVIEMFKDIEIDPEDRQKGLWICTSYDVIGRFHSDKMLETWQTHMLKMHNDYPFVKLNTTIIVMGKLCDMYLDNKFSFREFIDKYNTAIFLKQPGSGTLNDERERDVSNPKDLERLKKVIMEERVPGMFPKRKLFLKFLTKFAKEEPELYDRLYNIEYRADVLVRNFNSIDRLDKSFERDKHAVIEDQASTCINDCGHIIEYAAYIDCDNCAICDRNEVWEAVHGAHHKLFGIKE